MTDWVECVPNFSEGRNRALIARLCQALEQPGVRLLDLHADPDHHRSVFTLAGRPGRVESSILRAARLAVESIDLRAHRGTHPRIGALDVVPFVALGETSGATCLELARSVGEQLWNALRLPVYLYGEAAQHRERYRLESVRRLGFERLEQLAGQGRVPPDIGGPGLHPTAGACCVGVRGLLAAFNVLVEGENAQQAARIARRLREATGGLPGVKALGMYLDTQGCAQVSMNLTDLDQTPVDRAFDAVCAQAAAMGVRVLGSELVGLVPRAALGPNPQRLQISGYQPGMVLENRLSGQGGHGELSPTVAHTPPQERRLGRDRGERE